MLAKDQIEAAATNLDEAERSRVQTKLVSLTYPDMTMDDAYAIQTEWVRKKLASGRADERFQAGSARQAPPDRVLAGSGKSIHGRDFGRRRI